MAETLDSLALVVRNARVAKGWSQQRAAKKAGVSRRQWAALEHGDNVTVAFLAKVVDVLELPHVPIGTKGARAVPVSAMVDALQLFMLADTMSSSIGELAGKLAGHIEELRSFAVTLLMPASEQRGDASAIEAYVRDRANIKSVSPTDTNLDVALRRLASEETPTSAQPDTSGEGSQVSRARRKQK